MPRNEITIGGFCLNQITISKRRGSSIAMRGCWPLCLLLWATAAIASDTTTIQVHPNTDLHKLSLLEALEIGISQQVNIVQAHGGITQAESQKLTSISSFLPSLSIDDQAELYKPIGQSGNTFIAGTLVPTAHGFYNNAVTANFNFNLFSGGKDIAAYRAATDAVQSANAALQESINKVFIKILSSYVAVTKDEITIQKQRRVVALDQESAQLTQARYQHSMSSRIGWITAEQTALQVQTQLDQDLQQEASDRENLLRAMGYTQSLAMFTTNRQIPDAPSAQFSSSDQMDDPAVESARAQIAEAQQQVHTARAGFWPTLSLVAQYNWLGINTGNTLNAITATKGSNYTVGVALNIPLLPVMNVVASVQSAQAGVVDAFGNYDHALSTVSSRMGYATEMYRDAKVAMGTASQANKLAKENVLLTNKRYLSKQGNKLEVNHSISLAIKSSIANQTARLDKVLAEWVLFRSIHPRQFAHRLLSLSRTI